VQKDLCFLGKTIKPPEGENLRCLRGHPIAFQQLESQQRFVVGKYGLDVGKTRLQWAYRVDVIPADKSKSVQDWFWRQ
jgi:hypothetical protein